MITTQVMHEKMPQADIYIASLLLVYHIFWNLGFVNVVKSHKDDDMDSPFLSFIIELFIYFCIFKCTTILYQIYLCVAQFFEKLILSVARIFTISILNMAIFFIKGILSVAKLFTTLVLISS